MSRRTAFISHSLCLKPLHGKNHPENPQRLYAIQDQLIRQQLTPFLEQYDAPEANTSQLLRVHTRNHLNYLQQHTPQPGQAFFRVDDDTLMDEHTLPAARRAAGAGILAVDLLMAGRADNACCVVRPPGHHAGPERARGFCFFNNIAVAAAHALEHHGLKRIAIVDCDVHHGDGTEAIVANDPRIMFCSAYQRRLYPNPEPRHTPPHIIHTPLESGTDSATFRSAIREQWLPALQDFAPEMIFVSMGFDGHWEDDLADWLLTDGDYSWLTQRMLELANQYSQGRLVSMFEGGYIYSSVARCMSQHIRGLMGL